MPRTDPYRNFRFRVEIDGITTAAFSEATISDTSTDPIEYREGTDAPFQKKLSGPTKYGNITLKKGLTDSIDLYNWRKTVEDSGASKARKNMSLILIGCHVNLAFASDASHAASADGPGPSP